MGLDIYFNKVRSNQIGYFRKVNFLVKYFEKVTGFEIANLTPIRVSREDIEDLKDKCEDVLADFSLADKLLPTKDGFFFGSTDYDENYIEDVKEVKDWCDSALDLFDTLADDEYIEFSIWY
jgi:hypothetical protein